jgi:hypothetical protein
MDLAAGESGRTRTLPRAPCQSASSLIGILLADGGGIGAKKSLFFDF